MVPAVQPTSAGSPSWDGQDVIQEFTNGQASVDYLFDEAEYQSGEFLDMKEYTKITSASVDLNFTDHPQEDSYCWNMSLDAGGDGRWDWMANSEYIGPLGRQNRFASSQTREDIRVTEHGNQVAIRMPVEATITEASFDVMGRPLPFWDDEFHLSLEGSDSSWESAPRMIEYLGVLFVFWESADVNATLDEDMDIAYRLYDGDAWTDIMVLNEAGDAHEDVEPTMVIYDGLLYVIWCRGNGQYMGGGRTELVYRTFNGTTWSGIERISPPMDAGLNTYQSPVVYRDELYVVWKTTDPNISHHSEDGWDNDMDVVYRRYDGQRWWQIIELSAPDNDWSDWIIDTAVYQDKLYVVWDTHDLRGWMPQGTSNIVGRSFDGVQWSVRFTISPEVVDDEPSTIWDIEDFNARLEVFHNPVTDREELTVTWIRGIERYASETLVASRHLSGGNWSELMVVTPMTEESANDEYNHVEVTTHDGRLYAVMVSGDKTYTKREGYTTLSMSYGDVLMSVYDGSSWSPPFELTPLKVGTDNGTHPFPIFYGDMLHVAWATPYERPDGGYSWEIMMRNTAYGHSYIKMEMGDRSKLEWDWADVENRTLHIELDSSDLQRTLDETWIESASYWYRFPDDWWEPKTLFDQDYREMPLRIWAQNLTWVILSNLTIKYDYQVTALITQALQDIVDLETEAGTGDGTIPITMTARSEAAGLMRMDDLSVRYYVDTPPEQTGPIPDMAFPEDSSDYTVADLNAYFTDDWDGDALSYELVVIERAPQFELQTNGGDLVLDSIKKDWLGQAKYFIKVRDSAQHEIRSNNFMVEVIPVNDPPVIGFIDNMSFRLGERYEIGVHAWDVDGDNLTFSTDTIYVDIDKDTGVMKIVVKDTWPKPLEFSVTVTDPSGASDSQRVTYDYEGRRWSSIIDNFFLLILALLSSFIVSIAMVKRTIVARAQLDDPMVEGKVGKGQR
jgi:hypothetical protein